MIQAVGRIIGTPSCRIIQFYDVLKKGFASPKVPLKDKKELFNVVRTKIKEREDLSSTLVDASLFIRLVQIALEQNVLKVDQSAALNFGTIRYDFENVIVDTRARLGASPKCTDKCSDADAREWFYQLDTEAGRAKATLRRLNWWLLHS
jgi:hypothetical protein